jgi:hypothetical protein
MFQFVLALSAIAAASRMGYFGAYMPNVIVPPGLTGGAIGCGFVAAACVACITWIELTIYRKTQN